MKKINSSFPHAELGKEEKIIMRICGHNLGNYIFFFCGHTTLPFPTPVLFPEVTLKRSSEMVLEKYTYSSKANPWEKNFLAFFISS